jgi:hypothetical protein
VGTGVAPVGLTVTRTSTLSRTWGRHPDAGGRRVEPNQPERDGVRPRPGWRGRVAYEAELEGASRVRLSPPLASAGRPGPSRPITRMRASGWSRSPTTVPATAAAPVVANGHVAPPHPSRSPTGDRHAARPAAAAQVPSAKETARTGREGKQRCIPGLPPVSARRHKPGHGWRFQQSPRVTETRSAAERPS